MYLLFYVIVRRKQLIGFANLNCHIISNNIPTVHIPHDSCCPSSAAIIILLLVHVCFRESEGHSPLVKASLKGHHGVVKLLLKRGAKVEPRDLRTAIEKGHE